MKKSEALHVQYGTTQIPFLLQYTNRKTLSIGVTSERKVIITAPLNADLKKIFEKVLHRAKWINKQLQKFEAYDKSLGERQIECVSGETIYLLGRKYRLKVVEGGKEGIKLSGRNLMVVVKNRSVHKRIARLVLNWYKEQAKFIFQSRLDRCKYILKREKIDLNHVVIRKMEKRWGSCTNKKNIVINISLVQASVQCIDYVIIHEICHLKYLNHSDKFYKLLDRYVPDWTVRRKRLEKIRILNFKKTNT